MKTGHFGSVQDDEDEEKYYFNLIHLSNLTGRELAEKGPFKTIENLYKAYKFSKKLFEYRR